MKKIILGLSGGVDSAVSAYLLKQQNGYDITAVYIECWDAPNCRAKQDRQDALQVALLLHIPFQVLDFKKEYQQKVMSYFLKEYREGRTPNPDVLCNQVIKFGLFFEWAMQQGYDYVATGHYAQISHDLNNQPLLMAGKDLKKDQTYFLHRLRSKQLPHILFPIGHLTKKEVREIASKIKLPVATKKDSMGICFVGELNMHNFLRDNLGSKPGKIISMQGAEIGQHQGLWFYTIGQRHGFQLNPAKVKQLTNWYDAHGNLPPLFVIKKIPETNQLVVGPQAFTLTQKWLLHSLHQINQQTDWTQFQLLVKVRNTGQLLPCQLQQQGDNLWQVELNKPIAGIAAGQFSVFYAGLSSNKQNSLVPNLATNPQLASSYICLGGGINL